MRWWLVLVVLLVAGCASPGPTQRKGPHLEATLEPTIVVPGQGLTIRASVVNDAATPFGFQDCRAGQWLDDRGQTWGFEVADATRAYEGIYEDGLCPANATAPRASLGPGERATFVHAWGQFDTQTAPPGHYRVDLSFRGLHMSLPFELTFGQGHGKPVLQFTADKSRIRAGERVTATAILTNPTNQSFRYRVNACGQALLFGVETSQGQGHPPRPDCSGPLYQANLGPGQQLQGAMDWDGNWYDSSGHATPDPGSHRLTATFAYTDAEGNGDSVAASVMVQVD